MDFLWKTNVDEMPIRHRAFHEFNAGPYAAESLMIQRIILARPLRSARVFSCYCVLRLVCSLEKMSTMFWEGINSEVLWEVKAAVNTSRTMAWIRWRIQLWHFCFSRLSAIEFIRVKATIDVFLNSRIRSLEESRKYWELDELTCWRVLQR